MFVVSKQLPLSKYVITMKYKYRMFIFEKKNVIVRFLFSGQNNCDKLGTLLYEDIGCTPVKPEDSECPTKFECGNFTNQSNRCLLRGRSYNVGEHVDNDITYPSCNIGCFCSGYVSTIKRF